MKHGTRPTRQQKILLRYYHLNPENWLVFKNTEKELHITHRHTGTVKILKKEG